MNLIKLTSQILLENIWHIFDMKNIFYCRHIVVYEFLMSWIYLLTVALDLQLLMHNFIESIFRFCSGYGGNL